MTAMDGEMLLGVALTLLLVWLLLRHRGPVNPCPWCPLGGPGGEPCRPKCEAWREYLESGRK